MLPDQVGRLPCETQFEPFQSHQLLQLRGLFEFEFATHFGSSDFERDVCRFGEDVSWHYWYLACQMETLSASKRNGVGVLFNFRPRSMAASDPIV